MKNKNKMYLAPEVEVVEMEIESVLCASGFIDDLENGGIVDWFE